MSVGSRRIETRDFLIEIEKKEKEKELDCHGSRAMRKEDAKREREREGKSIIHIGVKFQIFETRKDRIIEGWTGNRKRIIEGNRNNGF